jgi:hypothetical protein
LHQKVAVPCNGWPTMSFMQRNMAVGDLARHLAVGSENEAADGRYIWDARRHSVVPLYRLLGCRLWSKEWVFHRGAKNVWLDIVKESAPTQMEEETTNGLHAGTLGAPTTSRCSLPVDGRSSEWWHQ